MAMSVYWSAYTCTNGKQQKTVPIAIPKLTCFSVMKFHRVGDLHQIGVHSSKFNSSPLKMVVSNRNFRFIGGKASIFRGEHVIYPTEN